VAMLGVIFIIASLIKIVINFTRSKKVA
jgi:hypothetical protein